MKMTPQNKLASATTAPSSDEKGAPKHVRTKEEAALLREKIKFVAQVMGQSYDLRLQPGSGWAMGLNEELAREREKHPHKSLEEFDPKLLVPKVLIYPEKDLLERNEDYIWGVFRHELGHLKHSDYKSLLEFQPKVMKEGYKPSDAFVIFNGWEDGRSNNMEAGTSRTAKHRLGAYLKEDIAQAMQIDLNKKPLPIQFSALGWAKGAAPFIEGFDFEEFKNKITDPRVLDAYEKTKHFLDEFLEERLGRVATEKILMGKAWPIFKKLIDNFLEDKAKDLCNKDKKKGEKPKESGSEKSEKKETKDGDQEKKEPQPDQDKEETGKENEEKLDQGDESSANKEKDREEGDQDYENLPDEDKQKYKDEARKELDREEKEFNEMIKPKMIKLVKKPDGTFGIEIEGISPEMMEEIEFEIEFEREESKKEPPKGGAKERDDLKKQLEELERRRTGLNKEEQEKYNEFFLPVKKYVDMLVRELDKIFPPKKEALWEGGYQRGKRIDMKKLAREIPTGTGKIFKRKEVLEPKNLAFSLLIDVSGSMHGQNIREAVKAGIMMAEALSKKGIPFEILAFNANFFELKKFDDKYFGKNKLKILDALEFVGGQFGGSYNDDGYAIETAGIRLDRQFLKENANGALIVFSDGNPAPSPKHSDDKWELHKIVSEWSKKIPLLGVGIGEGMERTIREYYGSNGVPVPDVDALPHALLKILKTQIARFE